MPALLQIIESLWLQIGPVLNYDLASSARAEPGRGPSAPPRHGRRHRKTRSRRARQALHADLLSASEYILARELLP